MAFYYCCFPTCLTAWIDSPDSDTNQTLDLARSQEPIRAVIYGAPHSPTTPQDILAGNSAVVLLYPPALFRGPM